MTTSRRSLLAHLIGAATPAAASPKVLPAPDAIGLLLNRATFGPREEEIARARSLGYDAWLDEQLAYEAIDDSQIEATIAANLPTVAMTNGQILDQVRISGRQNQALDELRGAILLRQVYSPRQLYEQMVEFWGNHFAMFHVDGVLRYFKTVDDREVVRRHALGRFGDLVRASRSEERRVGKECRSRWSA